MTSKRSNKRAARKKALRNTISSRVTHIPMNMAKHGYGRGPRRLKRTPESISNGQLE